MKSRIIKYRMKFLLRNYIPSGEEIIGTPKIYLPVGNQNFRVGDENQQVDITGNENL